MNKRFFAIILALAASIFAGCATIKDPYTTIQEQNREIKSLKEKLKERETEFETAKNNLIRELGKQIEEGKVKIETLERGLVLTMLEEVLFDSGKAIIKQDGKEVLFKIAGVLKEDCPDKNISIEGHTDNEPIKYSGWKSNWELSVERGGSVLHFFIDECFINPERLRIVGYGEYMPVASNDAPEGREENRRVEIVILPENIGKAEQ